MSERLEEIEEKYSKAEIIEHINGIDIIAVDKADIEWFTERVNELEKQVTEKHIAFMVTVEEMIKFAKRNDRYHELLTSPIIKDLIRLEDKGQFLPSDKREQFSNFKWDIKTLESESE